MFSRTLTSFCVLAGHTDCCTGSCFVSEGSCYCDQVCYELNDCCDDIGEICDPPSAPPESGPCVAAGFTGCCNDTTSNCTGSNGTCHCDQICYSLGDCCDDISDICDPQDPAEVTYLPFLPLGSTPGVTMVSLPPFDDGTLGPISIPVPFPVGNTFQTDIYVNTNGDLSFGRGFTSFSPQLFPGPDFLVAPFWADVDISNGVGNISYEVHPATSTLLGDVNNYISDITGSQFDGVWMLLAEWYSVPQYGSSVLTTNTFQSVVITSGEESYALYTYQCGSMEWPGGATIGFSTDSTYYANHRLSGTSQANEIACLNSPTTPWSNVLYQISIPTDDVIAGLQFDHYYVAEYEPTVQVCVVVANQSSAQPFEFSVFTQSKTAEGGTDYIPVSQSFVFDVANPFDNCVDISIVNDTRVEGDETLAVRLLVTGPNVMVFRDSANITIIDDDFIQVEFSNYSYTVVESAMVVNYGVLVWGYLDLPGELVINVTAFSLSAVAGEDFEQPESSEIVIQSGFQGHAEYQFSVTIIDDLLNEPYEDFLLYLIFDYGVVHSSYPYAYVTIEDDDPLLPVQVSLESSVYSAGEDLSSQFLALLVCAVANETHQFFDIALTALDGTATGGEDFQILLGNLAFVPSDETQKQCGCVEIVQDDSVEGTETFTLQLESSGSPLVVLSNYSAQVTIEDDDALSLNFINDSPRVDGNAVTAEFTTGGGIESVTCDVDPRADPKSCNSGEVTFADLPLGRRGVYNLTIAGTATTGETIVIYRTFRTDSSGVCWLHLINNGVTVSGNEVTVEFEGTGPQPLPGFTCRLDNGPQEDCASPYTATLESGNHELRIRPVGAMCARRIGRTVTFSIA